MLILYKFYIKFTLILKINEIKEKILRLEEGRKMWNNKKYG